MTSVDPILLHMPGQCFVSLDQVRDLVGLAGVLGGQLPQDHQFRADQVDVALRRRGEVASGQCTSISLEHTSGMDDALVGFGGGHH